MGGKYAANYDASNANFFIYFNLKGFNTISVEKWLILMLVRFFF